MRIVTIVGARPQFIKAAVVSRAIKEQASKSGINIEETIIHTGQHYDPNMSQIFFDELGIPEPGVNLEISGGSHGTMTGQMLSKIEEVLLEKKPNFLLIYGDTNSTLAGALAAAKMHIPIAHVEAGLRSFNRSMPEEVNRVIADHVSNLLLCPTETAVQNLTKEGITKNVHNIGDVMYDASLFYRKIAHQKYDTLKTIGLEKGNYVLSTCHRAENTDNIQRLSSILKGLTNIAKEIPVVLPLHPRTKAIIEQSGLFDLIKNIRIIEPVSFLEMLQLEENARTIITDSGGVQKEAYFFKVPCITMREETEWVETVDAGWNTIVGADETAIVNAFQAADPNKDWAELYGDGHAGDKVVQLLLN